MCACAVCLRDLSTVSVYAIFLYYWSTISAYASYLPALAPPLSAYATCLRYLYMHALCSPILTSRTTLALAYAPSTRCPILRCSMGPEELLQRAAAAFDSLQVPPYAPPMPCPVVASGKLFCDVRIQYTPLHACRTMSGTLLPHLFTPTGNQHCPWSRVTPLRVPGTNSPSRFLSDSKSVSGPRSSGRLHGRRGDSGGGGGEG
eukprot:2167649-Rhodomonas_salina.1